MYVQWDNLLETTRSQSPSQTIATSRARKNANSRDVTSKKTTDTSRTDGSDEGSGSESDEEEEEEGDGFDEDNMTSRQQQKKESLSTLGKKLSVLVGQLDDLRYKYKRSKEQNEKMDGINNELMQQIDTLEDENSTLHDSLKEKLEDAKRNKLIGGIGNLSTEKKRGGGARNKNVHPQKDQGGFNLALISDGDVDDDHVDFGGGGHSKSVIEKYAQKLFDYVPFKKDIQEVRSTFGGATASYFGFFRWM